MCTKKYRRWNYPPRIDDAGMRKVFYWDFPDAVTLEEVKFPTFRADIVEFQEENGIKSLIGYEIKSDKDNLKRLKNQLDKYLIFFNYVVVLTTEKHRAEVIKLLNMPEYKRVGVMVCKITDDKAYYNIVRPAEYQELKSRELSRDFITGDNQLYRYRYFLEDVWGIGND
jgi:histidinol phosphatase-like PHP family hydrolase